MASRPIPAQMFSVPKAPNNKYRASHMLRAHKPHALSQVFLFLHVPVVATLQLLLASSHSVEMV